MSRDGHIVDPFARPCWCGDHHGLPDYGDDGTWEPINPAARRHSFTTDAVSAHFSRRTRHRPVVEP